MAGVHRSLLGRLGDVGPSSLISLASSIVGTIPSPLINLASYAVNSTAPTHLPSPDAIFRAYLGKYLSHDFAKALIGKHGIGWQDDTAPNDFRIAWNQTLLSQTPTLSVSQGTEAYCRGILAFADYKRLMEHWGIWDQWKRDALIRLSIAPDVDAVIRGVRLGWIPQHNADQYMSWAGLFEPDIRKFELADRHVWTPDALAEFRGRGLMTVADIDANLLAGKYVTPEQRTLAKKLNAPSPGFRDAIRLSLLGMPDLSQDAVNSLLVEYPQQLRQFAAYDRKDLPLNYLTDAAGPVGNLNMSELEWCTHWRNISASEAIRIRALVRPDNIARWAAMGFNVIPFNDASVSEILRRDSVHPQLRETIVAASYNPIQFRQALWVGEANNWTMEDYRNHAKNINVAPDNVDPLALAMFQRLQDAKYLWGKSVYNEEGRRFANAIIHNCELGQIDAATASQRLQDHHVPQARADDAVSYATKARTLEDINKEAELVKSLAEHSLLSRVQAVVTRYRSRDIPRNQALGLLQTLSVTPADSSKLLDAAMDEEVAQRARQKHEKVERFRLDSLDRVIKSITVGYKDGLLLRPVAEQSLLNAGLPADAIKVHLDGMDADMLIDASRKVQLVVRRDLMNGGINAAEAVTFLVRAGMTLPAAQARVVYWSNQLHVNRRIVSAEKILGWVKKGLMPTAVAQTRLANLGWSGMDIQLAMADARQHTDTLHGKVLAAAGKQRAAIAKELTKLRKESLANARMIEGQIRRITPVATLGKWFRDSIVTEQYARARLAAMGETQDAVDNYIKDWNLAITNTAAKKARPTSAPPANGTAGPPNPLP